jgi:HPt (histidine-containing phosphotransfer) domain-containing protein
MNKIFDYPEALARTNGDVELLRELIGLFLEDYPRRLVQIKEAIATSDAEELARAVCDLRTSIGALGAQTVCEILLVLETMGIYNDFKGAGVAWLLLQDRLEELEQELLKYTETAAV